MAKWIEGRYSTWSASLAPGISIGVLWDTEHREEGPYVAAVMGRALERRHATLEEAKRAAEAAARSLFGQALKALDEEA